MSLELHCVTRQKLTPDPEYDAIGAIFYVVTNDVPEDNPQGKAKKMEGRYDRVRITDGKVYLNLLKPREKLGFF